MSTPFFDAHVSINLRAPHVLVQQPVPGMAERGKRRYPECANEVGAA